jgi:8-oxo-dGTP pyrophosphatase MutT (NUDIX family)
MRTDIAFGIIPVLPDSPRRYLLILHNKGHWGFPKGHKEGDESDLEAACRELQEETGLEVEQIEAHVDFQEQYTFTSARGEEVQKKVIYFLGWIAREPSGNPPVVHIQPEELADYRWCTAEEARQFISFAESRRILQACEDYLMKRDRPSPSEH